MAFSSLTSYKLLLHESLMLGIMPRPLFIAGLSAMFGFTSFFLLAVALPLYLQEYLHFTSSQIGTIIGFAFLMDFFAYVSVGSAADRWGPTPFIVIGALGMSMAPLLFGMLQSVWALTLATVWGGLMMSGYVLATSAFAGQTADPDRRGTQMGVFTLFSNAATAIGPPIGVKVYRAAGPWPLFLAACLCAVLAGLLGSVLLRSRVPRKAQGSKVQAGPIRGLRRLWVPALAVIAMGLAFGVVSAFMPGYLASRGVRNPGLFYSGMLVPLLALRAYAGAMSDRYGRIIVSGAGLVLIGTSVLGLYETASDAATLATGFVMGAGLALFSPVTQAWLFDLTADNRKGLASATYFTAQDIGRGGGSIGMGYLALSLGVGVPFVVGGLSAALAGLILLAMGVFHVVRTRRLSADAL